MPPARSPGFAFGALTILLVALFVVGIGREGPKLPVRTWVSFLLPIVLFQTMLNGTLLLDVWVLNNTVAQLGIESGVDVAAAAERASTYVGLYKAGQNFAFVPYQIILAVTFVVFPLVSRATASGDVASARKHIHAALRFSAIVLFALAAPISGGAEGLMRMAYGSAFVGGADTLRVLVFGEVGLALFVIIATILSGAGKPAASAWSGLVALIVVLVANRTLVRAVGLHDSVLSRRGGGDQPRSVGGADRQLPGAALDPRCLSAAPHVRALRAGRRRRLLRRTAGSSAKRMARPGGHARRWMRLPARADRAARAPAQRSRRAARRAEKTQSLSRS